MPSRTARDLGFLTLLTLALHLPFVGQAFHLDDIQYLEVAQNVYQNPAFPLDKPVVFDGRHMNFWGSTHPPLNAYVISAILLLNGRAPSEVLLHSVFLIFPLLTVVSFYFLAREFVEHAFLAAALLATNPTLLVSAHTLMADVPLLALWLSATLLFVLGIRQRRSGLIYASAVPMAAAAFYAYQGLAVPFLLAFYAFTQKRLGRREVLVLASPAVLLAGWQFAGYLHRGVFYASSMLGYMEAGGLWQGGVKVKTTISVLSYLGGTIVFFPFIFWKMGLRWKGALTWVGLAAGVALVTMRFADYTWTQKALFIGCFGGGVAALLWVIVRAVEAWSEAGWTADDVFLALWTLGILVACVVAFYSGSARYLLPAVPPLLLLLVKSDERRRGTSMNAFFSYGPLLASQLLLGILLAHSDYAFADTGRRQAEEFKTAYLGQTQRFLFSGEWGLRHYLTAAGGEIIAEDTQGSPGELFVKSRLCMGRILDNELGRTLEPVDQKTYRIRSPLRLLDANSRAGFWSDGWGPLPFSISSEALDEFSVYRVKGK